MKRGPQWSNRRAQDANTDRSVQDDGTACQRVQSAHRRIGQCKSGTACPDLPHSRRPSSFISFPSGHMARYAANVWSLGGKLLARSSTSESQLPGTNYSFSRSRTEYTHTASSDAQTVTNRKLAQCVPRLANFWHPLPYGSEAPILDTSRVH